MGFRVHSGRRFCRLLIGEVNGGHLVLADGTTHGRTGGLTLALSPSGGLSSWLLNVPHSVPVLDHSVGE